MQKGISELTTDLPSPDGWIQTYTGKSFYPFNPDPDLVDIKDIAHALSMQCRFAGHCNRFYSVAEHSFYVSEYVPEGFELWGLLHDASEAYLVDIPRPLKSRMGNYYETEANLMKTIAKAFNLEGTIPKEVKEIDNRILVNERHQNMFLTDLPDAEWGAYGEPLELDILFMTPEEAEEAFLIRFNKLTR